MDYIVESSKSVDKRLFVALALPAPVKQQLRRLQPKPAYKLRPVNPEHMHLTLQFIGQAELEPIAHALCEVTGAGFSLRFSELGKFGSPRKGGALWIGLHEQPPLTALAARITTALAAAGIERDARPFVPHITLARFRGGTRPRFIEQFLQQTLPDLPPVDVREFVLYSSEHNRNGSVYTVEQRYPLSGT